MPQPLSGFRLCGVATTIRVLEAQMWCSSGAGRGWKQQVVVANDGRHLYHGQRNCHREFTTDEQTNNKELMKNEPLVYLARYVLIMSLGVRGHIQGLNSPTAGPDDHLLRHQVRTSNPFTRADAADLEIHGA